MLKLYFSGYGYSKKLCNSIVDWFILKYAPRHHITIEVLHRGLRRDCVMGWCDVTGRTYKPREFLIEMQSDLSREDYITTLLHELYHVYQFVSGDLKFKSSKKYYKGVCEDDLEYEEREHEREASQKEMELYEEFITFTNT